jgi:hypothetical protein
MNIHFVVAAFLAVAVAATHSILGERWVFRRMRQQGFIPTNGGNVLREPHVRILWASWHLLSVLGLALATCLVVLAASSLPRGPVLVVGSAIAGSMFIGSVLVFVGTRAKHLGWLGLLLVSVFTLLGMFTYAGSFQIAA